VGFFIFIFFRLQGELDSFPDAIGRTPEFVELGGGMHPPATLAVGRRGGGRGALLLI